MKRLRDRIQRRKCNYEWSRKRETNKKVAANVEEEEPNSHTIKGLVRDSERESSRNIRLL